MGEIRLRRAHGALISLVRRDQCLARYLDYGVVQHFCSLLHRHEKSTDGRKDKKDQNDVVASAAICVLLGYVTCATRCEHRQRRKSVASGTVGSKERQRIALNSFKLAICVYVDVRMLVQPCATVRHML